MAKDGKKSLTCSELLNVSDNKRKPMWRVQIPEQLQDDVFILLRPRDKRPKEMWRFPENQYDFETMSRKLNVSIEGYPEYNYGVLCGKHLIIDADNAEKLFSICPELEDLSQKTFTVKSGRTGNTGLHIYLNCNDIPTGTVDKIPLKTADGEDLGDIRMPGSKKFFVVGPGSIHPKSGEPYTIFCDAPIVSVEWKYLKDSLSPVIEDKKLRRKNSLPMNTTQKLLDCWNVSCLDFLRPENAVIENGNYLGAHPVHGSENGKNLSVTVDGSRWFCFRHNCGGGLYQAVAVAYEIRECGDLNSSFSNKEWKEIFSVLREIDPHGYEQFCKQQEERKIADLMQAINNLREVKRANGEYIFDF